MEYTNEKAALLQQDGLELNDNTEYEFMKNNNAFTIKIDAKNGIGYSADFTVYNRGSELPASNTIYKPSLKELRGVLSREKDQAIYERIGTIAKRVSKLLNEDVKEQGAYLTRTQDGEIYITSVLVDYSNDSMMGELSHFSKRNKDWSYNETKSLEGKIEFVKETCSWTGSQEAHHKNGDYFGDYWSVSFMTETNVTVPVKAKKVEKEETKTASLIGTDVEAMMAMMRAMASQMEEMRIEMATLREENKHMKNEMEIMKEMVRAKEVAVVAAPVVEAEVNAPEAPVVETKEDVVTAPVVEAVSPENCDLDLILGIDTNEKKFVPTIPAMDEETSELLNGLDLAA
ncbi:hypothetical protein NI508_000008 [Salmonella enterica]|nr:hypothetical protein [Salmonella enterica]EJJ4477245.1 hypothetical protein [Salmonella enterica]EJJ4620753.1 hypothetical protein [Salmonella enterica]